MSLLQRVGPGDALVGLAMAVLVVVSLLPTYRARAHRQTVEAAVADVRALRSAALTTRSVSGRWPEPRPPGVVPTGAAGSFEGDTTMVRDSHVLEWRLLDRVVYVEAPARAAPAGAVLDDDEAPPPPESVLRDEPPDSVAPELRPEVRTEGAVVVHSGDSVLLTELLRRFGGRRSFVLDTTWTLIVPGS